MTIRKLHVVLEEEYITDLLVRYWGIGQGLSESEMQILLAAIDEENKALNAPIHQRALRRLKDRGIE